MIHRIGIVLFSLFGLWFSANVAAETPPAPDFDTRGYYTFRADTRDCAAPRCGGIFVKAVNKKMTRCANGTLRRECYIAEISNPNNIDLSTAGLLQGKVKAKRFQGAGKLGLFMLRAAFSPVTGAVPEKGDVFAGLEYNGETCPSTPCFSYNEYQLNSKKSRLVSAVDLVSLGVVEGVLTSLYPLLSSSFLIAAGVNTPIAETSGTGLAFIPTQAYLPIPGSQ